MVSKTPKPDEHLLPARYDKGDLFICDVADAVLKDLIPQMEHPFYSLSKKPEPTSSSATIMTASSRFWMNTYRVGDLFEIC
jgi:hypothetical protein